MKKIFSTIVLSIVAMVALMGVASADSVQFSSLSIMDGRAYDIQQLGENIFFSAPSDKMGGYELLADGSPVIMEEGVLSRTVQVQSHYDAWFRFEFGRNQALFLYYDEDMDVVLVMYSGMMAFVTADEFHEYEVTFLNGEQTLVVDGDVIGTTHKTLTRTAMPVRIYTGGGEREVNVIMKADGLSIPKTVLATGLNTAEESLDLVDPAGNFLALGVQVGDTVLNLNEGNPQYAIITGVTATTVEGTLIDGFHPDWRGSTTDGEWNTEDEYVISRNIK